MSAMSFRRWKMLPFPRDDVRCVRHPGREGRARQRLDQANQVLDRVQVMPIEHALLSEGRTSVRRDGIERASNLLDSASSASIAVQGAERSPHTGQNRCSPKTA